MNNSHNPKTKAPSVTVSKTHNSSGTTPEAKSMIKTGNRAVDHHCTPSTMTNETGDLVDKFRQLKFKEYNEICQLCQENSVPFTEKLLTKGKLDMQPYLTTIYRAINGTLILGNEICVR